eukprot:6235330-Alexandrium_andersonii.AAC.1
MLSTAKGFGAGSSVTASWSLVACSGCPAASPARPVSVSKASEREAVASLWPCLRATPWAGQSRPACKHILAAAEDDNARRQ